MKKVNLLTLIFTLFAGLLINTVAFAYEKQTSPEKAQKEQLSQQELVELYPTDFKPAFTRDTVIKLNAIVHRSYDVINTYDAIIADVKRSIKHTESNNKLTPEAKAQLTRITKLADESKKILADMKVAIDELNASKEDYNPAILAGMLDFVQDVEREIAKQEKKMAAMLNS
ncbi:hypothetical protein [Alteromonas sp. a30]|uniref:hypothetical protein n=1 Tax=Alteromonas sp. a30 TaxID=2730917 RepID=UPI002282DCC6|nr:hypothetical protein [Alteromonas sp. a30]MCY7294899.1 hypothetical protein [Alteromonas sp. a30]